MPRGEGTPQLSPAREAAAANTSAGALPSPSPPSSSAKRKAAEAALVRRFVAACGGGGGAGSVGTGEATESLPPPTPASAGPTRDRPGRRAVDQPNGEAASLPPYSPPGRRPARPPAEAAVVTIPPCGPPDAWCGGEVVIPRFAWPALAAGRLAVVEPRRGASAAAPAPASHLTVALVEDPAALPAALAHLRSTMTDRLVAIDLEWTPDRGRGRGSGGGGSARRRPGRPVPSPVALVQLATATHALLVRVCCFGGGGRGSTAHPPLHPALAAFLADPAITAVGFAWDGGDEAKAVSTWGVGRAKGLFGGGDASQPPFIDAQAVARGLNYARLGLGALASAVLGVALPKPAATATSDWGSPGVRLTPAQVRYAALDALAAGHLLRGLRLLHHGARGAQPEALPACPSCDVPVGATVVGAVSAARAPPLPPCCAHQHRPPPLECVECGSTFADARALGDHTRAMGHECGATSTTRAPTGPLARPLAARTQRRASPLAAIASPAEPPNTGIARRDLLLGALATPLSLAAATASLTLATAVSPPLALAGTGPLRPLPAPAAAAVREAFDKEGGKSKAPVLLRLAFHDAAAFDSSKRDGGANGSIRFELDRPESFGLKRGWRVVEAVAKRLSSDKRVEGEPALSFADLIALGGAYAVAVTGGPAIDVPVGRIDATAADPPGRMPSEEASPADLVASFASKGLSAGDLVALSGGHTLGAKGFGDPVTFDNAYYVTLLAKPWAAPGADEMATHIGLASDRALADDARALPAIKKYAADQGAFFKDFSASYLRMVSLGT